VERSEERFSKTNLLIGVIAFFCLHAISILVGKSYPNAATYPFLILAPAVSFAAALYRAVTATDRDRIGWLLFALALLIWTSGSVLDYWGEAAVHVPETVAWLSDFSYFLYGVPLLLILSLPAVAERVTLFLCLDAIQCVFTACIIYIEIFGGLPFLHGPMQPVSSTLLISIYNVENILLAVFATLRLIGFSGKSDVRSRYALLTGFLWAYAVCSGFYNFFYARLVLAAHQPIGLFDLLSTLPFLLLTVALLVPSSTQASTSPAVDVTPIEVVLDSASPILYTLTLLALGIFTLHNHFVLGVISIVIALVFFVIRSAVMQVRYLTTQQDLRKARDGLEILSQRDEMTGIPNRRCFEQTFENEWNRAYRARVPLSLLLIDVDQFKSINDRYGHLYGDSVLKEVAAAIQSTVLRGGDFVARYGGEEFVIILAASGSEAAVVVGTRILQVIRELDLPNGPITVSVGGATHEVHEPGSRDLLIATADQALYLAKNGGRDRLEFADTYPAYSV
jgi:diguanylate cyclase (GGDEF)-like protein